MRSGSPPGSRDYGRCACGLVRSVVARFCSGKPFVSRQQILFVRTLLCESDAMEKEKELHWVRYLSPRCLRAGDFLGCRAQSTTSPTQTPSHSNRVFFCGRLSSLTAHTCPSRASEEISCAERVGFLREGLRAASVRSCRFKKSPPAQGAMSANMPAQGSVPRGASPCRHQNQ